METAVGFSNIMPKTNLKTQVQASKYICVRLSELAKGTQWKDTQLGACFLRIKQWS